METTLDKSAVAPMATHITLDRVCTIDSSTLACGGCGLEF